MIELKHLKLIDAIDRLGTMSKAAKELNLSPSALSHQLKDLESYINTPIFFRNNNRLHFTKSGKVLKEKAAEMILEFQNLESKIETAKKDQNQSYIHGYSHEENKRLVDQATTIAEILHYDSYWPEGSRVLEVGCGVGAQTEIIASQNPNVEFTSIDISKESLKYAQKRIDEAGISNVLFLNQDAYNLNFEEDSFDHVFICFLLEHLSDPMAALSECKRVLKPIGKISIIEGDHGSTFFYPYSTAAMKAVNAQVQLQKSKGGNANIGRALYPMLKKARFKNISNSPRQVYVDESKPFLVQGFIRNTFNAMIRGIRDEAIAKKAISNEDFEKGILDLDKTAEGGTFSYTFFRAEGVK